MLVRPDGQSPLGATCSPRTRLRRTIRRPWVLAPKAQVHDLRLFARDATPGPAAPSTPATLTELTTRLESGTTARLRDLHAYAALGTRSGICPPCAMRLYFLAGAPRGASWVPAALPANRCEGPWTHFEPETADSVVGLCPFVGMAIAEATRTSTSNSGMELHALGAGPHLSVEDGWGRRWIAERDGELLELCRPKRTQLAPELAMPPSN